MLYKLLKWKKERLAGEYFRTAITRVIFPFRNFSNKKLGASTTLMPFPRKSGSRKTQPQWEEGYLTYWEPLPYKTLDATLEALLAQQLPEETRCQDHTAETSCVPSAFTLAKTAFVQSLHSLLEQPQGCLPVRQGGLISANWVSACPSLECELSNLWEGKYQRRQNNINNYHCYYEYSTPTCVGYCC